MTADEGYRLLAGHCQSICEAIAKVSPQFRVARGHYFCPIWNRDRGHWWLVSEDGIIYDPTREQFPSRGSGVYTELDTDNIPCSNCGQSRPLAKISIESNYAFCSSECHAAFVGIDI